MRQHPSASNYKSIFAAPVNNFISAAPIKIPHGLNPLAEGNVSIKREGLKRASPSSDLNEDNMDDMPSMVRSLPSRDIASSLRSEPSCNSPFSEPPGTSSVQNSPVLFADDFGLGKSAKLKKSSNDDLDDKSDSVMQMLSATLGANLSDSDLDLKIDDSEDSKDEEPMDMTSDPASVGKMNGCSSPLTNSVPSFSNDEGLCSSPEDAEKLLLNSDKYLRLASDDVSSSCGDVEDEKSNKVRVISNGTSRGEDAQLNSAKTCAENEIETSGVLDLTLSKSNSETALNQSSLPLKETAENTPVSMYSN